MGNLNLAVVIKNPRDDAEFLLQKQNHLAEFGDETVFLPVVCISNIISFTSPRDACVAASVSKTFELAVNSDSVWEKFLPSDYPSLIPQSRVFSSKNEIYFSLCDDTLLIEDGKKVKTQFLIERLKYVASKVNVEATIKYVKDTSEKVHQKLKLTDKIPVETKFDINDPFSSDI